MGFFSPWFLAGVAAAALPLWLHLLRQFKRTPQPFSSLLFFEKRIQSSSKHRRLRYLKLLSARLALLLLLVLLFANPFIRRASSAASGRKLTVVVIDRSFSMRYKDHLVQAKRAAIHYLNSAGTSAIEVMALDNKLAAFEEKHSGKSDAISAVEQIEPTDETSSYGEFSRALRVMEQATGRALDVHLFTDAQQTSMPANFADLQVGPHTSLHVHSINEGGSANWAVENVDVPSRTFDAAPVRLTAAVIGWQTPESKRRLTVLLDGHSIAASEIIVPASGRVEKEFDNLTIPFGAHRGEVRMEPHDELAADDSFSFSITRSDPLAVLFLSSGNHARSSFFYKAALDSFPAAGLRVQTASFAQAANLNLSPFAYVVLQDPGALPEPLPNRLSDYVVKGGGVFVAAGIESEAAGRIPVSGEKIKSSAASQSFGAANEPSAALFNASTFNNVQFVAAPAISPLPGDRILAHFSNGAPLLMERREGEGRMLILAASLDQSTSDFPLHASYLPFVTATGTYLAGKSETPASLVVGNAVALRQSTAQNAAADVIGPDGKHELDLSRATRITAFTPEREGFYEIQRAGGERTLLAVHADRRESNLTPISSDTLNLWRNTGDDTSAPKGQEDSERVPTSLWRYILALVLIAALAESILAARYLSEERQAV